MAKFNESEKAIIHKAKKPIMAQIKNKTQLIITIINTILLIYLIINK